MVREIERRNSVDSMACECAERLKYSAVWFVYLYLMVQLRSKLGPETSLKAPNSMFWPIVIGQWAQIECTELRRVEGGHQSFWVCTCINQTIMC